MKTKLSIYDFSFLPSGYGHYSVAYISPITGKKFITITNDMPLIDATKNAAYPKQKDLITLKRICKSK